MQIVWRGACVWALAWSAGAIAVPFTPGNLAVYRVGTGAGSLVNTGNPVFIDEYTPAGTLVQSLALPSVIAPPANACVASGTATSEGMLSRSTDGSYLVLPCYSSNLPAASSLSGTTGVAVPRVAARVDGAGSIDTSTALTDFASGNNPRSIASTNGIDLWVSGGTAGVRYATLGANTSTQLSTTVTNLRQSAVFDGQLYVSTSSGSAVRIGTVGVGLPTTTGQTISNLPGFPTAGSPLQLCAGRPERRRTRCRYPVCGRRQRERRPDPEILAGGWHLDRVGQHCRRCRTRPGGQRIGGRGDAVWQHRRKCRGRWRDAVHRDRRERLQRKRQRFCDQHRNRSGQHRIPRHCLCANRERGPTGPDGGNRRPGECGGHDGLRLQRGVRQWRQRRGRRVHRHVHAAAGGELRQRHCAGRV
jgi:hypothetical protein